MSSSTYPVKLEVWRAAGSVPAYVEVKGVVDITPPTIEADDPADGSYHGMPSDVRVNVPAATKKWTNCTAEVRDVPTDPGQIIVAANIGATLAFQVTKVSDPSAPIQFWAIIKGFVEGPNPINGVANRTLTLIATGVTAAPDA